MVITFGGKERKKEGGKKRRTRRPKKKKVRSPRCPPLVIELDRLHGFIGTDTDTDTYKDIDKDWEHRHWTQGEIFRS